MNYTKLRKALGLLSRKALAVVSSLALLGPIAAPLAYAGPTEDVASKFYGMQGLSTTKQGGAASSLTSNNPATSTTTVILNLSYSGTAASANITVGATGSNSSNCITFYAPEGTIDTTIGSATCGQTGGSFDLGVSTMLSLGQLCDAINGVVAPFTLNGNANGGAPTGSNYHCTLVGGVRTDSASNYLPLVTEAVNINSLNAVGGYQVPSSTAALISLGIIPAQGRHVVLNYCEANSAGTPSVYVYGVPIKDGIAASGYSLFGVPETDGNIAWISPPLVANTSTLEPTASSSIFPLDPSWIEFSGGGQFSYALNVPPGHAPAPPIGTQYNGHVVVRVNNYGLGAALQGTSNFLTCNWAERSN